MPRYATAVAKALDGVAAEFDDLHLVLVATAPALDAIAPRHLDVRQIAVGAKVTRGAPRVLLDQFAAATSSGDLDHHFDLTGTLFRPRRRFVTTVHDASASYDFSPFRYRYKRTVSRLALRRCAAAVAVSAFARDEAIRRFDADPKKLTVIHSGPGLEAPPRESVPPHEAQPPVLLCVGTSGRNKNVSFLVRAFDESRVDARLVLVGDGGDEAESVRRTIASARAPGRIEIRTQTTDQELEGLYAQASALLLPSTYEGFGFTALEAMARGCPVVASDIPAVREVSGEGALLVPPEDLSGWSTAISSVVGDRAVRADLRLRGAAVVERYSWSATARQLCSLFRSTAGVS